MRSDRKLREAIASGEPLDYEGSLTTLERFAAEGVWPDEDEGWVKESCSLLGHGWWSDEELRRAEIGRRSRSKASAREQAVASVLLGDLARHAPFGAGIDTHELPGARECFMLIDAASVVGGPWPAASVRWLASYALWRHDPAAGWASGEPSAAVAALAFVATHVKATTGAPLPVAALFDEVDRFEAHLRHERECSEDTPWLVGTIGAYPKAAPLLVAERLLAPSLERLEGRDREAVETALARLRADRDLIRRLQAASDAEFQSEMSRVRGPRPWFPVRVLRIIVRSMRRAAREATRSA